MKTLTVSLISRVPEFARLWLGTPFAPHACIRGAGVDCVHLCAAIYIEAGVLEIFDPPKYTLDGGKHADKSLVIEWLERSGRFTLHDGEPATGDLVCFAFGKQTWHVGVFIGYDRAFIHAIDGLGVIESKLDAPKWHRRLTAIYRPITS